ncbi:MAG: BMP family ABC transporter substrate-binding protein [Candidatus Bathyarchaeia archaeon]
MSKPISIKTWQLIAIIIIVALIVSGITYAAVPPREVVKEVPVEKPVVKKLKAGFIYVGPIGDYGWTHAHDQGRKYVANKFPWLETVYAEAVAEADVDRYIDRFITEEKVDIVFTTSFGYMDATIAAGKKYPDKIFMHCSGYKRAPNVGTYFAEFYQLYYLNGLMAGALTKTNKVGYVAAHPIPEVIRHINAFALGVREVNPQATVSVRWLFAWYDPAKAREAAEALIAEGVDAIAFTEDSPTVLQVGQEYTTRGKQIYTFSHYSPMQKFGPDTCVSGQLVHWEKLYEDILMRAYLGVWDNRDYWWMLKEGAVELGGEIGVPINSKFIPDLKAKIVKDSLLGEISVYDLVMKRLSQMSEETVLFDPFTGPIKDQDGKVRIEAGRRASHDELWTMDWFVEGVIGTIPR